jgi:carbamoyl-phosphate synthase large subunit
MKRFNVLLTAGSRRVPLVHGFRSALKSVGAIGSVIVTDVNPLSPAVHVADRSYRVPLATDPGYIDELLAICEAEGVKLVVPTIDDELATFGATREAFRAIGAVVGCSPEASSALCNDKYATCRHLLEKGVPAARSYLPAQLTADMELPLFIKPRIGRGAVGAFKVRTPDELDFFLHYVDAPIVQEYLAGPEFTLDVMCDFQGRPLSIVPRERADRQRPAALRPGRAGVHRGAVLRADQHPVPHARGAAGDLRDQSTVLRRDSAHHPGRRQLPGNARQAGHGPPR